MTCKQLRDNFYWNSNMLRSRVRSDRSHNYLIFVAPLRFGTKEEETWKGPFSDVRLHENLFFHRRIINLHILLFPFFSFLISLIFRIMVSDCCKKQSDFDIGQVLIPNRIYYPANFPMNET